MNDIKLKITVIAIAILFLTSNIVMAKAEKANNNLCLPRVPVIELDEAIKIAKENNPSSPQSFIDYVSLECKNNTASWDVGFRLKNYETGHYVVTVFMDGTTKASVIKDG